MVDIANRADILLLMRQFYKKLLDDDRISYLFTDVAQIDLEHHFPVLADFWESILFGARKYTKNTMQIHLDMHRKCPFNKEHFDIWLEYFITTVDNLFEGTKAHEAKARAQAISSVMQHKVLN